MDAAGIGIGIGDAAQAAAACIEAEREDLITIEIIDRDVAQAIGHARGESTAGAWRADGGCSVGLGGQEAVGGCGSFRAAIFQGQVDAGTARGGC